MDGKLVWITGLAGTGKTTLALKVYEKLKKKHLNVVHLDGDTMREVLGGDYGHDLEDRKRTARIYARLAHMLTSQGINVIVSTISLFHEIHDYNAKNSKRYVEVLVQVSDEELKKRNKKGLYTDGSDVMGVHQKPEFPKKPTIVLKNDSLSDLEKNIQEVISVFER